jgi:hypothetical protein
LPAREFTEHRLLPSGLLLPAYAVAKGLEHDPEKWKPVFRKDHAQTSR